jgi:diadenosine tetraphosphate (Ap4A) HIT family hydrolase
MTDKEKKNCTTIFLLPSIGHTRQGLLKYGFLAAYLNDINHDISFEEAVYCLFKPSDMAEFQKFLEHEHEKSSTIVEDYDYEGGYVVVVYKVAVRYLREYQLFLEGKYSKFSNEYINLFPTEVFIQGPFGPKVQHSLHYHIFNRTKDIKDYWEKKIGQKIPEDMEMWSKPDIEKEILDITLINKND